MTLPPRGNGFFLLPTSSKTWLSVCEEPSSAPASHGMRPNLENQRKEPFSRKQKAACTDHFWAALSRCGYSQLPANWGLSKNTMLLKVLSLWVGVSVSFPLRWHLFEDRPMTSTSFSCPTALVWRLSQALPHTWACLLLLQTPPNISQWKELFLTSHLP